MKHEGWIPPDLELALDADQITALQGYAELLHRLALPRGMVARSDASRIWTRHVLDGLRGAPLIPSRPRTAVDLGSGAGIPGVPIAIARPDLAVVLSEPRRDRAAFLELVAEKLALRRVTVHVGRAEEVAPGVDVCLARAFRGPAESWRVAEPLLAPAGRLLYWAGSAEVVPIPDVRSEAFSTPSLADAGPIVMMTRQ